MWGGVDQKSVRVTRTGRAAARKSRGKITKRVSVLKDSLSRLPLVIISELPQRHDTEALGDTERT